VSPGWGDLDRGLFSISVAAELAGLHPQTLRIYEREGLLDPARSAGGTRRYSRRDIEKLAEICALTADGLNLAGIRRVLQLQEETRQLQAELARLRELVGQRPAPRRGQLPGRSCPASRACRRAVRTRSAARSSSRAVMRSAAARVCPWSTSSRIRAARASWRRE
jgi:MerR family transcriptional regulator, heat shock protein HspR